MSTAASPLRSEFLPSTQLEELFFDAIVRLSTCASFLAQHITGDPEFTNTETPRRMRLLLSTESKLRYAYEEFRRLKMARQLQLEDAAQAARPLLAVVATHTSRSGFRTPPKPQRPPNAFDRQLDRFILNDAAEDAQRAAAHAQRIETFLRPPTPGRNSACPCNSGLKFKRCCATKQLAA